MALERRGEKLWFFEDLYRDTAYGFEVSKVVLPSKQTKYQKIMVLDTPRLGKALILDGIVQFTEEDENIYHETVAHWPLFSHPNPKNVLIVGGGDGGVLREVLKHKNIKNASLVEIDSQVPKICKKYLPKISNGAFNDRRVKVYHQDAAKFVHNISNKFDIVIMDTTDPIGPSKTLFGANFVQDVYKAMADGGILVRQAGSVILQPYELRGTWRQAEVVFGEKNIKTLLISSTTFFGGSFSLVAAIKGKSSFNRYVAGVAKRYREAKIKTSWYSDKVHQAISVLSPSTETMLKKERYGEEIAIDLTDTSTPFLADLKSWSIETCEAIKMVAFGTPMISDNNIKAGASFVQYIETSAINYRQNNETGCANVFTCAELPTLEAIKFSMDFFRVKNAVCWHIPRGSFGKTKEIQKDTKIFNAKTGIGQQLNIKNTYLPILAKTKYVFSNKFNLPISKDGAPAFELIMDLYDCDYNIVASCEAVKKWAKDFCKVIGVAAVGKTDAPDFGHAKKKTAGPSAVQFFDKGSNISHYSSNWLAMLVNIVSRQEFDLKKAIRYTMKFFKAGKAMCWILPRGLKGEAGLIAKKTIIFEVNKNDIN